MLLPPPFPLLQVSARRHGGRGSGATIEQATDDVASVGSSTIGRFCLDTVPPRRCSFPTSDEPARLHDTAQQYASVRRGRVLFGQHAKLLPQVPQLHVALRYPSLSYGRVSRGGGISNVRRAGKGELLSVVVFF